MFGYKNLTEICTKQSEEISELQTNNEELRNDIKDIKQNFCNQDHSEEISELQASKEELRNTIEAMKHHFCNHDHTTVKGGNGELFNPFNKDGLWQYYGHIECDYCEKTLRAFADRDECEEFKKQHEYEKSARIVKAYKKENK
jgi:hypothetical protein